MDPSSSPARTPAHRTLAIAGWTALVLASIAFAWYQAFGSFADYDDEGYFLSAAKHLLDGKAPYTELQILYGPFYLLWEWVSHRWVGMPVTHDAGRLRWIAVWMASSGFVAWAAFNLTRRMLLAAAAFALAVSYLSRFSSEPGHPQDLCVLLIAAFIAAASGEGRRATAFTPVLAGAVAAALALTKVNIGVFFALPVLLAATLGAGGGMLRAVVRTSVGCAVLLLPFAIAKRNLADWRILLFACLVSLATVLLIRIGRASSWHPGRREAVGAAAGALSVAAVTLGFALAKGATPGALLDCLLLMPMRLAGSLAMTPPLSVLAIPACIASSVLCAVLGSRSGIVGRADPKRLAVAVAAIKSAYGFGLAACFAIGPVGLSVPSWYVMGVGTPFLWLAMVRFPAGRRDAGDPGRGRMLLCFLAALLPFQAFPIAGSQCFAGTFLQVLVAVVCIGDVITWTEELDLRPVHAARVRSVVASMAVLSTAGITAHHLAEASLRYRSGVPIDQPGARWVRTFPFRAATFRRLTADLGEGTHPLFCTVGFNSLHFWTGRPPINPLVLGNSLEFFSAAQQDRMIADLDRQPGTVVVHHEPFGPLPIARPGNRLIRHIEENYVTYAVIDGYELRRRRDVPAGAGR